MDYLFQRMFKIIWKMPSQYANSLPRIWKKYMITLMFLIVFYFQFTISIEGLKKFYIPYTKLGCMILIVIGIISLKKNLTIISRRTSFSTIWLCFCLSLVVSEIILPQKYKFVGLTLLFVFTNLFYIWNNIEKRSWIWKCYILAVRIAFIFSVVFCFMFRAYHAAERYLGLSVNPNIFSMFLLVVFACELTRFETIIDKKKSFLRSLSCYIEIGLCIFFIIICETRTAFLSLLIMCLLWFLLKIYSNSLKYKVILLTKYIFTLSMVSLITIITSFYLIQWIPKAVNHPITFEKDAVFAYKDPIPFLLPIAYAADKGSPTTPASNISNRFRELEESHSLDDLTNGRFSIYQAYIAKCNWIGHRGLSMKIHGTRIGHSHNNIIQFCYTYGYCAGFFYALLNILSFIYSIQYYLKNSGRSEIAALPLLLVTGFLLTSLTESIFIPFQSTLAFSYWIIISEIIPKGVKSNHDNRLSTIKNRSKKR